ncbi:28745_t:CDS:2 [Racocetra persica]|uniref:28745_t:CDS:1 n=1 Tax=Racocetra persica TaxID=160502 RepID=A0ACA9M1Y4_9GLOM|nr:28745_t:CDS:2 [Racocetra persica]
MIKNNLSFFKKDSIEPYNFYTKIGSSSNIIIRRSLRIKQQKKPTYNYKRNYNQWLKPHKNYFYYCDSYFDSDIAITTESTISKRFLDYNTDDEDNNSNSGISEELNIIVNDEEDLVKEKENNRHEEVVDKILLKTSNTISHNFEKLLAKSLNKIRLVANIIAYNPGDFEIDIIATLNKQIFLIQCKNIVKSLGLQDLQKIKSAFKRFGEEIGIIYNSEKLQKLLTKQAKIW